MPDTVDRLLPGLRVGERVSLQWRAGGDVFEVLGFVTALDADTIVVLDRHCCEQRVPRAGVAAGKRMAVALGRDPARTPRPLLDALAARAHASGTPHVARISALLDSWPFPASVPACGEWATFDGVPARSEGEWVTLAEASPQAARAAAWWATRMGARSVLVTTDDAGRSASLIGAGFTRLGA